MITRVKMLGLILAVLILSVFLSLGMMYLAAYVQVDETPFEFRITVHGGPLDTTTYYTNDPPMLGGNSIMFFDALTGLEVVEIAPRITIKRLYHPETE